MKLGKRGQVTIFIILGIIIIMIAVGTSYLRNEAFREKIQSSLFRSVVVPEQAQGVVNFVSECMQDIAKEGMEKMSWQGGYIELPDEIKLNPENRLEVSENIFVPYWLYAESNVNFPTIKDMELMLEDYVERKFTEQCGFDVYREQGYNIPNNEVNVVVTINNDAVNIKLDSELRVGIKNEYYDLNKYVLVNIPSKFKELYDISVKILNRELENAPLEFNTMNLLSIYAYHNSKEIPFGGMEFSCGSKKWLKPNIKEILKNIISENIPKLRVEGTNYIPVDGEFYQSMVIDNVLDKIYDVSVRFSYFKDWPFFLDISPSKGLVVEADNLKLAGIPFIPIFCVKNYDFKYDIRYPVLIEVIDSDTDFAFRYAIEVLIKDNYGRKRLFSSRPATETNSLLCEEGQRKSGDVEISTWDAKSREALEGVDVIFNCVGVNQFCSIGNTELDRFGVSSFKSKFPLCKEGEVHLSKDDYLTHRQELDTYVPTGEKVNVGIDAYLEPFRIKKAIIKVLEIKEDGSLTERSLGSNEVAIIQLNRLNLEFSDYDYKMAVSFDNNEEKEFEIVPADGNAIYEVQSTLVSNEKVHITSYDLGGGNNIPAFDLDGGVVIGGGSYTWRVNSEDLDKNNKIVFYVLSNGLPKNYKELEEGMKIDEKSSSYELTPLLKNE